MFQQAVHAFADKLYIECTDVEMMRADPGAVVLVIHAAALLAVLGHAGTRSAPGQPLGRTDVLAGLLRHEARYWQQSQAARGLGLDGGGDAASSRTRVPIGADDETSAVELLAAIRDLSDPAVRGKAARWLRALYPVPPLVPGQQEWMGTLQPDLILEQLVVSVLGQQPDLIPALFAGLAERRASRALTILARAALTDPAAGQLLESALNSDLEHLAVPALAVAVETNPAVGGMIRSALSAGMPSADSLERIARAVPYPSVALADTAVLVIGHLVEMSVSDEARHAYWLVHLSNRLSDLGRREEALAAIEEAVTHPPPAGPRPPRRVPARPRQRR